MGTFTTKLSLGKQAFVVSGGLDPEVHSMTVGQIRVIETLPSARGLVYAACYVEEYMCVETGVGGGSVYTYGRNIFATPEEAQAGVLAHRQALHLELAAREKQRAEQAKVERKRDMDEITRLQGKYGVAILSAPGTDGAEVKAMREVFGSDFES